jgi:probable F420-dependent oxidoreductase
MSPARPFRFGVDLQAPIEGRTWLDSVREVESLGYATLFVPDHFDEAYGPLASLGAAAAITTTLRLGTLVLDCDFRHPAVLAREFATIDLLSDGRLEVGLGAGWKRLDYERSGIPMDPPKVRVDRMIEHTKVLRGLFAGEAVTFAGEHYRITDLDGTPKPVQDGGPPFLIGGGGRRVLRFAARHADIVGVNASIHSGEIDTAAAQDALPSSIDEKVGWVREAAGDRLADVEINSWLSVAEITADAVGFAAVIATMFESDPETVLTSPLTLIGTETEVAERLRARRERWGYSYVVIPGTHVRQFAPVVAALTGT